MLDWTSTKTLIRRTAVLLEVKRKNRYHLEAP